MTDHSHTLAELTLFEKAALLSGANVWETRGIPRLGIPRLWMSDGPHGLRKQRGDADHLGLGESDPAVCFPTAATVANSWDEELAEEIGTALGQDAASRGVHMLLGPGLNIKRSPLGGRNFEYFSEDPELSGRLAAAYVRGIQSTGVAATPKHFAANSQELRRLVSDSIVDERTLREVYLTAFEIVVRDARPWALMTAYNLVNGTYSHENRHLLIDILRDEWGFDGLVVSDWGGADDPVASVASGGTIEMPSPGFDSAHAIVEAVRAGRLDPADLDARVDELLTLVDRVTAPRDPDPFDEPRANALARRAAAEGAVLLRNENATLPLAAGTSVALIGAFAERPRYQGAGSSIVNPTRLPTLRDAIVQTQLTLAGFAEGFRLDDLPDDALITEAVALARTADVVVLALGLPAADESEGIDRRHLALPAVQVQLLRALAETGIPIVVVLAGGGAIETPWIELTASVLHTYLGGQAGALATWDVLTGVVNPGGRLAETLPVALADDATARRFPSDHRTAEYREGPFVRYRHHASAGVTPAFPFGFGLSYTSFAYEDLSVTEEFARFTVTNTGPVEGSEVAQLYVRRSSPSGFLRPAIELKGFVKLQLAPGEQTTVEIPFGERTFRVYDVETSAWQVETGEYEILVGPHSGDLPLAANLDVEGTIAPRQIDPALEPYVTADVRDVSDAAFEALLGHPIPAPEWHVPPYGYNSPLDLVGRSPSRLVRFAFGFLERAKRAADGLPHPDITTLFIYYAPFRAFNKMTGGAVTREATDAVITIANGRVGGGFVALVRALVSGRQRERASRERFARAAAGQRPPAR
ncbi:glycoside hydrolase family 3 C-terminal domain-containing protein [Microbacterium sp. SLBN-146]|uniref:glycoside hydrolase family 3 C-terminal domain-containing protein n=1 Tax=Microbacterium sp. SLBN-146 TaxID=2768457 RepID=UPI0011525E79|nr:glycoside hydrolase family 3 C-terminal domain-containing protein [Microbacterium sp. SLBN-146]TQJ31555.1 beta-glucosidase [Microbacterium sp. SLBN-146]